MLRLIRLTESDEGTDPIVKAVLDAYGDRLTQDEAVRLSTDVKRYVKELIRSKGHVDDLVNNPKNVPADEIGELVHDWEDAVTTDMPPVTDKASIVAAPKVGRPDVENDRRSGLAPMEPKSEEKDEEASEEDEPLELDIDLNPDGDSEKPDTDGESPEDGEFGEGEPSDEETSGDGEPEGKDGKKPKVSKGKSPKKKPERESDEDSDEGSGEEEGPSEKKESFRLIRLH